MAIFKQAFDITMGHEGGYANDPTDTGGETLFGITRRDHPTSAMWVTVDAYKKKYGSAKAIPKMNSDQTLKDIAQAIYKQNYWNIYKLDSFESQAIANELFDTGVNMGTSTAAGFLQEALNLTNNAGKIYPNLVVDGNIGPLTLSRVNGHPKPQMVLNTLNLLQGERYLNIMRNNETQEKFWASWLNRVLINR